MFLTSPFIDQAIALTCPAQGHDERNGDLSTVGLPTNRHSTARSIEFYFRGLLAAIRWNLKMCDPFRSPTTPLRRFCQSQQNWKRAGTRNTFGTRRSTPIPA